ncbi:MTH1187 family thiamine-binding protein [Marisediminicola sp. LYQ85]|uniref:thiamine-binding protein n=1 Tax=Marisediminicola sp. LYQ85 TaxID=3391062 RepID=UPI003983C5E0
MLVAFSVAPSGVPQQSVSGDPVSVPAQAPAAPSDSVHDAVAAAVAIVRESGLPHRTDAMFTTIEGEWDEVFDVVKRATEAVGRFGSRVSLVLKADIRPGYTGELTGKLDRLESAIEELG